MIQEITLHGIAIWIVAGFFVAVGWTVGTYITSRILSALP
jgi:hypothetical protein